MARTEKRTGARPATRPPAAKQPRHRPAGERWARAMIKKNKGTSSKAGLREVARMQRSTALIIKKAPFVRVVKAVTNIVADSPMRYQPGAMEALHIAAEQFLVTFFEDSNLACIHAKRTTLMPEDIALTEVLRDKDTGPLNN